MKSLKTYPLNQSPLYKLASRKQLAREIFNFELSYLEKLANNPSNFRVFTIEQNGKARQVETPKPSLERIHRRLFTLLGRIEKPAYLQSGVKKRSYITNAKLHIGRGPLVKLDIKKFYPSVDAGKVYRFYNQVLQCSPDVASILTKLCTYEGHIPTGSCVSQLLAYYSAKPMFDDLHAIAESNNACFSCYVDDITFSGERATPALLWAAKKIVHSHGFMYHKDGVYRADQKKVVTGLVVEDSRVSVMPSKEHNIWKRVKTLHTGDVQQRRKKLNSLIGSVIEMGQIEPRLLARLKRLRSIQATLAK